MSRSGAPNIDQFIRNPSLESLAISPELIDRVGEFLGKELANVEFPEHQLRRIHSELIRAFQTYQKLQTEKKEEYHKRLSLDLVRTRYFVVYQSSRLKDRRGGGYQYFELMHKLTQEALTKNNYTEFLFRLSEAIIAYYNYYSEQREVRGRERATR